MKKEQNLENSTKQALTIPVVRRTFFGRSTRPPLKWLAISSHHIHPTVFRLHIIGLLRGEMKYHENQS